MSPKSTRLLSGERTPKKNPFEYGRELNRDELVDRTDELRQVTRAIENTGKLFLIGPRRYGKTSLLNAAAVAAEEQDIVVLRYDAERYESLDLLGEALLTAATRRLATTVERAGALLKSAASKLKPEVSYDLAEQTVSVTIGAKEAGSGKDLPVLVDVLDAIEKLAQATDRDVVVIIDEFQHVVALGGEAAERQIRAAVQRHRRAGYIFAGSATRLLADMTGDQGRAFYKLGARLFLGPIPRPEFSAFLRSGFECAGFTIDDAAITRLLDLAEDVPYTVQRLAHECWEILREAAAGGAPAHLDAAGVDVSLARVLKQEDAAHTQIWNSLTTQQKRVIKAIVLERGRGLFSADVARRRRVPTPTMQTALRALDARGTVREEEEAGTVRYRLEDPLFGHWILWSQQIRRR